MIYCKNNTNKCIVIIVTIQLIEDNMNKYEHVIEMLCESIGLPKPPTKSDITSIKVGEQECHITEHPAGRLLMFSSVGTYQNVDLKVALEMAMFCQDEAHPVVGYDDRSDNVFIWSQQSMDKADKETLYHQMELLSKYYDDITQSTPTESLPSNDTTTKDPNNNQLSTSRSRFRTV